MRVVRTTTVTAQFSGRIDRTSPEPYYLQLVRLLEADIDSGRYEVGDRLPGETEMCREFALARSTVRETLRSLQMRGRIEVVPRRGAFVLGERTVGWHMEPLKSFLQLKPGVRSTDISTKVLKAGLETLPPLAASQLQLEEGTLGFALRRVRSLDGQVGLVTDSFLPSDFASLLMATNVIHGTASLHDSLAEAGHGVVGTQSHVEAVNAPSEIAEILLVDAATPLLRINAVCCRQDKTPVHAYTTWLRTDVVNVTLVASIQNHEISIPRPAST